MEYLPLRKLLRNPPLRFAAKKAYLKACMFFGTTLIDRTGILETGIDFRILDPLVHLDPTGETFERICLHRARLLLECHPTQTIRVLWSGGIDSTVSLVALLQAAQPLERTQDITVLLSEHSIAEFPSFYDKHIGERLSVRFIKGGIHQSIDLKEVNVTGEHGDQLFGSDKAKYFVQTEQAYRPYQEVLPYAISRKLGAERHTKAVMEFLEPQVATSPVPIQTLYDFLWWMNFSLKWQAVSMRLLYGLGHDSSELDHSLHHFFSDREFQRWSISNHPQKIHGKWHTYKQVAKEFIHRFHPDENYLRFKEKEQSLREVLV